MAEQDSSELKQALISTSGLMRSTGAATEKKTESAVLMRQDLTGAPTTPQPQYYSTFYEFAPYAYFTLNSSGIIFDANQAAVALLKRSEDQLVGRSVAMLVAPDSIDELNAFLTRIYAHSTAANDHVVCSMIRGDEIQIHVQIAQVAIPEEFQKAEKKAVYFITLQDVTESYRVEKLLCIQRDMWKSLTRANHHDKLIQVLLDFCMRIEEIDFAAFYDLQPVQKTFQLRAVRGILDSALNLLETQIYGRGILEILGTHELLYLESRQTQDINILHLYHTYELKGIVILPMYYRGQVRQCVVIGIKNQHDFSRLTLNALEATMREASDIFARVQTEMQLRRNERQMRTGIDNAPAYISVKDISGRFLLVNQKFLQVADMKMSNVLGKTMMEIFPKETAEIFMKNDQTVLQNRRPMEFEESMTVNGRELNTIALKFPLFNENNEVEALCAIITDISEIKSTQSAMRAAAREASAANNVKSQFIANMSHELRTPMNAIIGFTEMVLKTPLDTEQRKCLELVLGRARDLLVIMNDILEISKIDSGKTALNPEPVDLGALVDDVVRGYQTQAREKKIFLKSSVPITLAHHYYLDPVKLRQILNNLVGNAIKFTATGGIIVTVASCGQKILEDQPAETLLFTVSDTGCGIKPDVQPKLFEPFVQGDSSKSRKYEGSGLGLSICKRIVESMNGRIWFESTPGSGTSFFFKVMFPRSN